MKRLPSVFAVAALLLVPSAALAQRDPAAAEALFRQGRDAADKQDWKTACPKFAESYRFDPARGTALNLADCEEHIGLVANAWQRFHDLAEELPPDDDRRGIAKKRAEALEKRLPHLTLTLAPSAPPGTTVTRDDIELGTASFAVPIPVNPVPHVIVVKAPGRIDRRITVTVNEGQTGSVVLEPGEVALVVSGHDASGASGSQVGSDSQGGSGRATAGWVAGGAGVVALGVGTYFGLSALSKKSDAESGCVGGVCATPAARDAANTSFDSAKSTALAADIFFGVGLVAVGVGTYLVVTSHGKEPTPPASTTLRVMPAVGRSGGGAVVQGAW